MRKSERLNEIEFLAGRQQKYTGIAPDCSCIYIRLLPSSIKTGDRIIRKALTDILPPTTLLCYPARSKIISLDQL